MEMEVTTVEYGKTRGRRYSEALKWRWRLDKKVKIVMTNVTEVNLGGGGGSDD